jgi:hypothetical protein
MDIIKISSEQSVQIDLLRVWTEKSVMFPSNYKSAITGLLLCKMKILRFIMFSVDHILQMSLVVIY